MLFFVVTENPVWIIYKISFGFWLPRFKPTPPPLPHWNSSFISFHRRWSFHPNFCGNKKKLFLFWSKISSAIYFLTYNLSMNKKKTWRSLLHWYLPFEKRFLLPNSWHTISIQTMKRTRREEKQLTRKS